MPTGKRKRAIDQMAKWLEIYVTGRNWRDGGDKADSYTWDETLCQLSVMLLHSELVEVLQRNLNQRRFTLDQNIRNYWDTFQQDVSTWPASMQLSERELSTNFLDSMPSSIQARSRDAWKIYWETSAYHRARPRS